MAYGPQLPRLSSTLPGAAVQYGTACLSPHRCPALHAGYNPGERPCSRHGCFGAPPTFPRNIVFGPLGLRALRRVHLGPLPTALR